MKPQLSPQEIIEEFLSDREAIERLRVTPQEIYTLSSSALLGSLTSKQDMLFMLRLLREDPKSEKPEATALSEPVDVPEEDVVEPPKPDHGEMAERLRLEALAKLTESESSKHIVGRGALRQFFSLLLAPNKVRA